MTKKIIIKQQNNPKEDYKMNRITLSFISCLLLVAINTNLQAQCVWTSQAAGAWTDAATWMNDGDAGCGALTTPPTDVPSGVTVTINHNGVTHNGVLDFRSGSTLNLNSGSFLHLTSVGVLIDVGAVLNVNNAAINMDNNTNMDNYGTVNIMACLVLNTGSLFNNASGTVNEVAAGAGIWAKDGDIYSPGTWTGVDWCEEGGIQSREPTAPAEDCNTVKNTICADVVPVELSYFGATAGLTGVQLNWTTESEIENLGFVLERKTADSDFIEIASYKTDDALLGQGSVEYATDYEYVDSFVKAGQTYEYRLGDVDYAGTVTYHAARSVTVTTAPLAAKVEHFTVLDAYPNPFNPSTTLRYALPAVENNYTTTVQIYDLTGKLVKTLLSEQQPAGWHSVVWQGTDQFGSRVPAGVYLSKVSFGSETKTIKVMLLK